MESVLFPQAFPEGAHLPERAGTPLRDGWRYRPLGPGGLALGKFEGDRCVAEIALSDLDLLTLNEAFPPAVTFEAPIAPMQGDNILPVDTDAQDPPAPTAPGPNESIPADELPVPPEPVEPAEEGPASA